MRSVRGAASGRHPAGLGLLALTLSGRRSLSSGGFAKVLKMLDGMVEVRKREQDDDDHKEEYCGPQLDSADDKKKALARAVSVEDTATANAEEGIATLTQEIGALEAGIRALHQSVM